MKNRTKVKLKKDLWKVFSIYIRTRDKGKCFTCGDKKEWKRQDAGHFIPKSICGEYLYFDPINVNCQCTRCNRFLHGNLTFYALYLQRKYGKTILEELEAIRRLQRMMPYSEMLKLETKYKKKTKK